MVWIPGGTFRMGSDRQEAPVHRVSVSGFWMDRTPITNREFRKFVNATGYVTSAETRPEAKDYPGALPHMLKAGSLIFTPPKRPVDLRDWSQMVEFQVWRQLAPAIRPPQFDQRPRRSSRGPHCLSRCRGLRDMGW
ncbi:formylglycine-generating enzyme required for sulfatase activity [Bradyrhizobium elkanii]